MMMAAVTMMAGETHPVYRATLFLLLPHIQAPLLMSACWVQQSQSPVWQQHLPAPHRDNLPAHILREHE